MTWSQALLTGDYTIRDRLVATVVGQNEAGGGWIQESPKRFGQADAIRG